MKFFAFVMLSLLMPALSFAYPDLRITARATGPGVRQSNGNYHLPVSVSVTNRGDEIAGRFKIGLAYAHEGRGGLFSTVFNGLTSPGNAFIMNGYYVWSNQALFPARSISFRASVVIQKPVTRGATVSYRMEVDSCAGDEFMPFGCRVFENDRETNNYTELLTTVIP